VRCEFAKEFCEEDGAIPYVSLYYCQFEENTVGTNKKTRIPT